MCVSVCWGVGGRGIRSGSYDGFEKGPDLKAQTRP